MSSRYDKFRAGIIAVIEGIERLGGKYTNRSLPG